MCLTGYMKNAGPHFGGADDHGAEAGAHVPETRRQRQHRHDLAADTHVEAPSDRLLVARRV